MKPLILGIRLDDNSNLVSVRTLSLDIQEVELISRITKNASGRLSHTGWVLNLKTMNPTLDFGEYIIGDILNPEDRTLVWRLVDSHRYVDGSMTIGADTYYQLYGLTEVIKMYEDIKLNSYNLEDPLVLNAIIAKYSI